MSDFFFKTWSKKNKLYVPVKSNQILWGASLKKTAFTFPFGFLEKKTRFSLHNFHIAEHSLHNMTKF